MDCEEIKANLEEILDQASDSRLLTEAKRHCLECAPCSARYEELRQFSRAMSALSYFSPRPGFAGDVLAALGIQEAAEALPEWIGWAIGALSSLVFCWVIGILFLIRSRLSWNKVLAAIRLIHNPERMEVLLRLRLARAPLMMEPFSRALRAVGRFAAPRAADLSFQLAVAALIAGIFMVSVLRQPPVGRENKKWRMV